MVSGLFDGAIGAVYNILLIIDGIKYASSSNEFWTYTKLIVKFALLGSNAILYLNSEEAATIINIFEGVDMVADFLITLYETFDLTSFKDLVFNLAGAIKDWLVRQIGEIYNLTFNGGYIIGNMLFEIILAIFTGGTGSLSKLSAQSMKEIFMKLKNPTELVDLLSKSWKSGVRELKCKMLAGCFVKDTPVLMGSKPTIPALALAALPLISPVQDIKPDDIVKAYHHTDMYLTASNDDNLYVPGWQDYDYLNITPETWQIGTFEIIEANGNKVEVEANRPKTWYQENNVNAIGDKAYFYMPEIGINGNATLLSIRPTVINTTNMALNEAGMVDRPVITTFKRNAPVVFDYHFSDGAVIGATPEHPFFSVDRNAYIAVGELQLGEQVMTAGEKVVKFIAGKRRDKGEPVYNFEVWREHNYYVSGKDGGEFMLVHNSCWDILRDIFKFFGIDFKDARKLSGKKWAYALDGDIPLTKEIDFTEEIGEHLKKKIALAPKGKQGFDAISEEGKVLSYKIMEGQSVSSNLSKLKDNLSEAISLYNKIPQSKDMKVDIWVKGSYLTKDAAKANWELIKDTNVPFTSNKGIIGKIFYKGPDGIIEFD